VWRELPRLVYSLTLQVIKSKSYFALFSLEMDWAIDLLLLKSRYLNLQKQFHPDKFLMKSSLEKRLAMQTASLINDAYDTLASPLKRAQYLLDLRGYDAQPERHTSCDGLFLMEQIELREELEMIEGQNQNQNTCKDLSERLGSFSTKIQHRYESLQNDFSESYAKGLLDNSFSVLGKMQFFAKLLDQVEDLESRLIICD
jgi:molecular chaperone HscB